MLKIFKTPLLVIGLLVPLSGCALPPAISIASLVFDIGSFAVSGKTLTDHGLSLMAQEDCAVMKVFEGQICEAYPEYENTALATLEPLTPGSLEWAYAGNAAQEPGVLSDLDYIAANTVELPAYPDGENKGRVLNGNSLTRSVLPASQLQASDQVAEASVGGLLGLDGYLSDNALPGELN